MNEPSKAPLGSPVEDHRVWKNILQEVTAGAFVTTREDIRAEGRIPSEDAVGAVARLKLGVYLQFFEEVTDPRFVKRAKKAFERAREELRVESENRKEVPHV